MEHELEKFGDAYIEFVEASIAYIEVQEEPCAVSFESELEWIKNYIRENFKVK